MNGDFLARKNETEEEDGREHDEVEASVSLATRLLIDLSTPTKERSSGEKESERIHAVCCLESLFSL